MFILINGHNIPPEVKKKNVTSDYVTSPIIQMYSAT